MKSFIDIPSIINYKDIMQNYCNLSSNAYKCLIVKNYNLKSLKELLDRNLLRQDLGYKVGSLAYAKSSKYFFIKSRAL
ncbi:MULTISPECIES: hypothetical protein [unclassified Campylobacter]|uniref:hypothetical protein n=1 Tax=unclassified Campylobacter TaxID=2593542 RepID=UPI001237BD6C|nr:MULTISPECIES: hypothetical protein [unclassified Campylobacter]KAA6227310.1 hypothetical protein FMM57_05085 [Campylobacter sp. LR286c]KAA6227816.1 hypothetical protein FMM54_01395 [Campylobacter sp. LR185c]KAA6228224.1 hypothetical protein FMM55_01200 [Campylobacter sp. LR196d]KAA6229224.1 hypothetical protein FMM58_07630 [Campylobacter sp. LR291e]KAA6231029.1 hypothetical protein FMM56_04900 [Campylobacter sp. LR264d]